MAVYLDIFDHKFEQAQQHVTELVRQTQQVEPSKTVLTQVLDELSSALEEVHVLSEELSEQHDHLQIAQTTLATERQQYFELFDLAPEGYFVTNSQGMIEQINQAAANLLNRPQTLLTGKPLAALIGQSDVRLFYTLLNRLQQGDSVRHVGISLKPAQKPLIYGAFTIAPVLDYRQQLVGFRWLFRDMTQERQSAIALEKSETQYRAIVEDQTELICRSLADGRLAFVNQAFCRYFGQSPELMMGKSFFSLFVETEQETLIQQLAHLDRKYPVITHVHQVALPDGQIRWQQWVHRALFDSQGDFFQFQSSGRDITDQKQAEETLSQRDKQLHLITDALPVLLAYVNASQQLIYVNRTHEHWAGKSCEKITGEYLWEVLGPSAYQQIKIPISQALMGEYVTFERAVTFPHQAPFWISATLVPDKSNDDQVGHQVKGCFILVHDISDRKALEFDKDELIGLISKKLLTPLESVHVALQLLKNGSAESNSPEGRQLILLSDQSVEKMANLVNNLIEFQKIKLGKISPIYRDARISDLINRAIDTFQITAQARLIALVAQPCSLSVWAAPEQIVKVLSHLIHNAIKFSSPGDTIRIAAKKVMSTHDITVQPHIQFQVCDEGKGMSANHLADVCHARRMSETGLGLEICRGIIERHGGSLQIESELNKGTTVSFTLSVAKRA